MKKLLTFLFAASFLFMGVQQIYAYDFTVSGQVLKTEAQVPAPNVVIDLNIFQIGIMEGAVTDDNGDYSITVQVDDGAPLVYELFVLDTCMNVPIIRSGEVVPEGAIEDFLICEGYVQGCYAYFFYWSNWQSSNVIEFFDMSDFQPGTWYWEFGDGETSNEQNPMHEYAAAGEYEVSLTIVSEDGTCDETVTELVYVEDIQFDCEAFFEYWPSWENPLEVQFQDASWFQPGTWYWEFGDGETSNESDPFHTYAEAGEYEVSLTINGADSSCYDMITQFIYVEGGQLGCESFFEYWPSWENPLEVQFQDASWFQPGTWYWEFGDGETSYEQNPTHQYAEFGEFEVSLTINGADSTCYDVFTQIVIVEEVQWGCQAAFGYWPDWENPTSILFFDMSNFQPGTWYWEFGDGESSNEQNPMHEYAAAGEYEVSLTIVSEDGTCDETVTELVYVEEIQFDCEAFFEYWPSWENPLEVQFQDASWFQPGTWYWEFGDGETSNESDPFHTYAEAGEYEVSLTINGADSSCYDMITQIVIVEEVQWGCEAAFGYWLDWENPTSILFFDMSNFQPGTWYWEFGDGETSSEQNPTHQYAEYGEFEVSLTIMSADSRCNETVMQLVIVEDMTMNCTANFWWHHNFQSNNPLEIKFMNNSYAYGPIISFAWDFGDGTTSDEEDPIHLYTDFGLFDVSLTIETESGCTDEVTYEVMVMDWTQDCLAIFVPYINEENPLEVYFEDYSIGEITDWYWEFGDGEISNEQNPTHQYAEAALYSASLTITTFDCTSTFYYDIDLVNGTVAYSPGPTTGIYEKDELEVSIYPNPVQNVLNIQLNTTEDVEIQVVNMAGQLMFTSTQLSVDVSSLSQGVYFVKIVNNGQATMKKFIK